MNEKWLIVCPLIDENCNARYWSFPCTIVCNKKTLRVLFLPLVRNVLGKFMLKLLLVEAYGSKVQQVCLVVVGLGSPFRVSFVVAIGSGATLKFHTWFWFSWLKVLHLFLRRSRVLELPYAACDSLFHFWWGDYVGVYIWQLKWRYHYIR